MKHPRNVVIGLFLVAIIGHDHRPRMLNLATGSDGIPPTADRDRGRTKRANLPPGRPSGRDLHPAVEANDQVLGFHDGDGKAAD
jgi:hypothetical protein